MNTPKALTVFFAIMALTIPIGVYIVSQTRSIADIRNYAAGSYGGTNAPCQSNNDCANGYLCTANKTCQGNPSLSGYNGLCGRADDPGAPVCCTKACATNAVCESPNRLECIDKGFWCTINAQGCTEKPPKPPATATPSSPPSGTPTPSATSTLTPTPTLPELSCQLIEAWIGTKNVSASMSDIKYGDTVTFKGFVANTGYPVASMTFQITVGSEAKPAVTRPATLTDDGQRYIATYEYTFSDYAAHKITIIGITPE